MKGRTPPPQLVPKLRFPEFRDSKEWEIRSLNTVVRSISSGLTLTQNNDYDGFRVTRIETIADGTVDINRVGYVKTDQDIFSYRLCIGDILISNINSITHIGKSILIDCEYNNLYHGMNLLRIKSLSGVIYSKFLYNWLNTDSVRASIRSRANKAVNQASINQTEMGKTVILLPLKSEQQKIADCLGSLDELITASEQKLEALRQHKRGLMQQLFPQPGENVPQLVPKLRFPEFRDSKEWEIRSLNTVVRSISSGLTLTQNNDYDGFRVTRIETIADGTVDINRVGYVKTDQDIFSYRLCIGDILISNINSITHIGKSILIDCEYNNLYHGMNLLRIKSLSGVIYSKFLYNWLNTDSVRASIRSRANKAVNQASINQTEMGKTVILLPLKSEQQKIADCLGSLDELITASEQKLEALRQHKRGLMQNLFPSLVKV